MSFRIDIQKEPFNHQAEYDALRKSDLNVGAVVTFAGTVRDINEGDAINLLYLEHYPGMTEKELSKIVEEARQRWQIIDATVIHRIGELHPGDEIVFVGVASRHRGDAFKACEFVMDYLKTRATFWKKEITEDGDRWLDTRQSDVEAAEAWQIGD